MDIENDDFSKVSNLNPFSKFSFSLTFSVILEWSLGRKRFKKERVLKSRRIIVDGTLNFREGVYSRKLGIVKGDDGTFAAILKVLMFKKIVNVFDKTHDSARLLMKISG